MLVSFPFEIEFLGFIVDHDKDREKIHHSRKKAYKHDAGVRDACQFCHNKATCTHDRRHKHPSY